MRLRRDPKLQPTYLPCVCGCVRLFHRDEIFDGLHGPDHGAEERLAAAREAVA